MAGVEADANLGANLRLCLPQLGEEGQGLWRVFQVAIGFWLEGEGKGLAGALT